MTLRERVVEVLERWCGDDVVRTDEKLEELWNRTKPTGKPSHDGIDFFQPGASDLVDSLTAEYQRPRPELRNINFGVSSLDPATGTIITIDDLFVAVGQCPIVQPPPVDATLSAAAREALVADIADAVVTRLGTPKRKSAAPRKKPAKRKKPARKPTK